MEDLRKTMTKKAWKELQKAQRSQVSLGRNLGTITMKTAKYPTRQQSKAVVRKELQY